MKDRVAIWPPRVKGAYRVWRVLKAGWSLDLPNLPSVLHRTFQTRSDQAVCTPLAITRFRLKIENSVKLIISTRCDEQPKSHLGLGLITAAIYFMFNERTRSFDPQLREEVLKVIQTLSETGMTLIVVTHEMNFTRDIADSVFFFGRSGRRIWAT